MGGSGCGKSTVLKSMIGLLRPRVGHFFVEGEDYWAGGGLLRTEIGPAALLGCCSEERGALERDDSWPERRPADADVHQSG